MTYSYRGPINQPLSEIETQAIENQTNAVPQAEQMLEEDEKKRQAQLKATEQQRAKDAQDNREAVKKPNNPVVEGMREVGTAVVGAGIDLAEGIGATAEQTVKGQLMNPDFTPTWLQVDDNVEPMNKTIWGQMIRTVGEFGLGSLLLRKGAKGAAKVPIPGVKQAGKFIGGTGSTKRGNVARDVVRGAIVQNLSSQAEEENLSNLAKDVFPWFPDALAIDDNDNPLIKRAKNMLEGAGLDMVADLIGAGAKALIARRQNRTARAVEALEAKDPAAATEAIAADTNGKALALYNADVFKSQTNRQKNFDEMAQSRFEKDPDGVKGPDPYINSPLYDSYEKAAFSIDTKDGLTKALLDVYKIDTDPRFRDGRPERVYTESALENRLAGEDKVRRGVIEQLAKKLGKEETFKGEVNGVRVTRQEYKNLAVARALDILDEFSDPEDLEAFQAKLLDNSAVAVQTINGKRVSYLATENLMAAELYINITAGELADLATGEFSLRGAVDVKHQENMLLRRMDFLLRETKKAKFIWGQTGNAMQEGGVKLLNDVDVEQSLKKIDADTAALIDTMRQLRDNGDDKMLKLFIDASRASNGDVNTLTKLDAYAREKVGLGKWGNADNAVVRGFISTFTNSVLSSWKTSMRAWVGTGTAVALRPITLYAGGLMRGDARLQAKALHQMAVFYEGFGESWAMANKAWKNFINHESIPYQGMIQENFAFHKTDEWKQLGAWVEERGSLGDKAGYRMAHWMSAFNNSPFVSYSMGTMGAGDAANRTIIGRMELKSRAFDKAWDSSAGKVDGNLIRKYEEELRSSIFNKDGIVTDRAATLAGDEASLTTELGGKFQQLDNLIQENPYLKPFFLFPRTGINALKYSLSYSPIGVNGALRRIPGINGFLKEVDEVMNVTTDNMEAVMTKYGITDLAAAQAMYEGRIAVGTAFTMGAIGLYLNSSATGNGPADKETRNAWVQAGWKPRSIRIGSVWVGYDSLDPFAGLLALVADIGDNSDQMGSLFTETWFQRISYMVAMHLTNKSFLAGLQPIAEILSAGGGGGEINRTASMLLNNAVPYSSLRKELAEAFNPGMRELEDNFWDAIKNRNPGLKDTLPMKVDIIDGTPLKVYDPMTRFFNALVPYQMNLNWDETREMLRLSGYDMRTTLSTNSNGDKLDNFARARMQNEMGKENIHKQLTALFNTPAYRESFELAKEVRGRGIPSNQWPIDASFHIQAIKGIFERAKNIAEARINAADGVTDAVRQSQYRDLGKDAAKRGDEATARQFAELLNLNK